MCFFGCAGMLSISKIGYSLRFSLCSRVMIHDTNRNGLFFKKQKTS